MEEPILTMVTDETEYEPASSNPDVYIVDDIEVTIAYVRPGVYEVSFLAPKEGLSEETLTKIDNLIKEKTSVGMGSNP